MGKPLSIDLRQRVRAFVEAGHSRRAAAERFDVSPSAVIKLMALVRATGSVEPARQGRPPGTGKFAPFAGFIRDRIEEVPDMTMPELAEVLQAAHGLSASPAALSRFLIRKGSVIRFVLGPDSQTLTNRSPKITANCVLASNHSRGGRFHASAT